jgi:hypothetical protein
VFATLGVGERLDEPELAVLDELGMKTVAGNLAVVVVEGAREDKEIIANALMCGV